MPNAGVLAAFVLILLSSLNPGVLVVSAVYLGKNGSGRLETVFLITGLIVSVITGIAVLILVRETGLALPTNRAPNYGIRLGLGILALLLAAILPWLKARQRQRAAARGTQKPSLATRMMDGAEIGGAIVVGILIYSPGVNYLAGTQGIAAAEPSITPAVLFILLAALINVSVAVLYLTAYLRNPDRTRARLARANTWLSWIHDHSELVARTILAVAGVYLVISGTIGLTAT